MTAMEERTKPVSLWSSLLFTICSILSMDTFVAPAMIGVSSILVWVVTAVLFFIPYGLISAELGSTYPDDGGIYVWIKKAFGNFWGVLNGWFYWINVAFWMPAVFVAFSSWLSYAFFPSLAQQNPLLSNLIMAGVSVLMCWVIVWIGVRGIELSVRVSNVFAVLKVAVALIFGVLGIVYAVRFGVRNDFSLSNMIPTLDNTTQYIAVILYALLGFELIGSIGGRIQNPQKTIPKMTVLSGAIITVMYIFGTFGILAALPAEQINEADGFYMALEELTKVLGPLQKPVFYLVILVAMLTLISNMVTWTLGANEVMVAAGLDRRSKLLKKRSRKYGTPLALYLVMGIMASMLIVLNFCLSGDANDVFWTIFAFSFVIFMIPYLFMFPAVWILRVRDPKTPRVYRVPGGNVGLCLCVVLTEGCMALSMFFVFKDAGGGAQRWMLIIGTIVTTVLGILLYRSGRGLDRLEDTANTNENSNL